MKKFKLLLFAAVVFAGLAQAKIVERGEVINYLVIPGKVVQPQLKESVQRDIDVLVTAQLNELAAAQMQEINRDLDRKIEIKLASYFH